MNCFHRYLYLTLYTSLLLSHGQNVASEVITLTTDWWVDPIVDAETMEDIWENDINTVDDVNTIPSEFDLEFKRIDKLECEAGKTDCAGKAILIINPLKAFKINCKENQCLNTIFVIQYNGSSDRQIFGIQCEGQNSCSNIDAIFKTTSDGQLLIEKLDCSGTSACQNGEFIFEGNAGFTTGFGFDCSGTDACTNCQVEGLSTGSQSCGSGGAGGSGTSTGSYHGDFNQEGEWSGKFKKAFECEQRSTVEITYKVVYCGTSNQDVVSVYVDDELVGHSVFLFIHDHYGDEDSKITDICYNDNEIIGTKYFIPHETGNAFNAGEDFTVEFDVRYHLVNHIWIHDIQIKCNPTSDADPSTYLTPHPIYLETEFWLNGNGGDPDEIEFVTDGTFVALQGQVKWVGEGLMGSRGWENHETCSELYTPGPTSAPIADDINPRIIGSITEDEYHPAYDSVFTVTNDYGLYASIQIGGKYEKNIAGNITLLSWTLPLAHYNEAGKIRYDPNWDVDFTANATLPQNPSDIANRVEFDIQCKKMQIDNREEYFSINLDGVVFAAAGLSNAAPSPSPETTAAVNSIYVPDTTHTPPNSINIYYIIIMIVLIILYDVIKRLIWHLFCNKNQNGHYNKVKTYDSEITEMSECDVQINKK